MTTETELNAYPGCGGNQVADPFFVDPANGDYHLAAGSPAIDSGSCITTEDFELDPRPLDGNGDQVAVCDAGFDERDPTRLRLDLWRSDAISLLDPTTPPRGSILPLGPADLVATGFPCFGLDPGVVVDAAHPLVFYAIDAARPLLLVKAGSDVRLEF